MENLLQTETVLIELLLAQRGALHPLQRDGLISSEIFEELTTEIDRQLDRLEGWVNDRMTKLLKRNQRLPKPPEKWYN